MMQRQAKILEETLDDYDEWYYWLLIELNNLEFEF